MQASGRWVAEKQGSLCGRHLVLSGDILGVWVGGNQPCVYAFRKDLPESPKNVGSDTDVGNGYLGG